MHPFRADLHTHTTYSDGTFTPAELIAKAVEIGLSGLSITDHDTVDAYVDAIPLAKAAGILLGNGVEFSAHHLGFSVHILGYDFDLDSPELKQFCKRHIERRLKRNREIGSKLERIGMPIDLLSLEEEVKKGKPIGRPHLAAKMKEKGYVSSIQEAFNRFLGEKMPCYARGETIEALETIQLIQKAGGKAFLAHPHLIRNNGLTRSLLTLPFDGIEVHYSLIQKEQEHRWIQAAKERGLLMSGGSDFHGQVKEQIPLGCSWVDEKSFHAIFSNRVNR